MGAPARRFVRGPTAQKAADVEGRDCRPTGCAGRVLYKLLLNGTSVEVANGRDVSASTIVLNGGPAAVAGATVVIEMGMATGMR